MKKNLLPSILLSALLLLLCSVVYTGLVWGAAQLSPNRGKGFTVQGGGKTYYSNIAQSFTDDAYFSSRPSAVAYNAAGSAGSNKGPSAPDHIAAVSAAIDSFLAHNPSVPRNDVPADLVTASGSGLDPHISVQGALVQAPRIAAAHSVPIEKVRSLISEYTARPLGGFMGPSRVHVLRLNLALDNL